MTSAGAEKAVTTSALIVAGVYTYRRLTEGSGQSTGSRLAQLAGNGSPPGVGTFITAWGFAFLVISMITAAAPGLGGPFALLVATGDLLNNASQVSQDINTKLTTGSSSHTASTGAHSASTGRGGTEAGITGHAGQHALEGM